MNTSPGPIDDYPRLAGALTATGLVTDPWVDGQPRFATRPLVLPARQVRSLYRAAEQVAAAVHEAALQVADDPALLDDFFALTPVQKLLWQVSAPLWHGMARADLFLVEGPQPEQPKILCCELNADTPSGQPEAVLLGPATGVPAARDPNRGLEARFGQLVDHFLAAVDRDGGAGSPTVGIVYPTEIAGDFALIRLYQRWCQARGLQVVLGSPYNLRAAPGDRVALFGTACDLILRHYKTDWWGERLPIWADEDPYPDPDPLSGPLSVLLRAVAAGRCAVMNPFGAVLTQNKRMLAYLWERQDALSPASRTAVRAHLPESRRLEATDRGQLEVEQADWVLKSDYGCEGEEVIIGRHLPAADWRACLDQALPRRWIAQRFFDARRTADGDVVNHGVYLVAGRAAGVYARLSSGATDAAARSAAIEVLP
jgi:glutathionylspermidine synthase